MGAIDSALVIGAGAAGASVAALLSRRGVNVDLVEASPEISALGSGITLQGNALRVLREVGVLDQLLQLGYPFDTLGLRTPGGDLIVEIPDAKTGGPDLPATLGMSRPDMARVLVERALADGAHLRLGTTVASLHQDDAGVAVELSDGTTGRYDLVVGADGVNSTTRSQVGVDLATHSAGMGIWRVFAARPASVERTDLTYGGVCHIAGYCPTGPDTLYAYLVEDARDRTGLGPAERLAIMQGLADSYGGPWVDIRQRMVDAERVNYTIFEHHLLPAPWHRGRVVLIGDAVHVCPPTLAQGAAMALEDASVLAELVLGAPALTDELLVAFTHRRFERVETIVQGSMQLVTWLLEHDAKADVAGLMGRTAAMLAEPA